jgi:hypothetical protein
VPILINKIMDILLPVRATSDFQRIAEAADVRPVAVRTDDDKTYVVMSQSEYDALLGKRRARTLAALDRMHDEVRASGASEAEIEEMIRDAR